MTQTNTMTARQQNFMHAVRHEMGWPAHKPANDCIAFCTGQAMDFETGSEMARIAQMIGKDAIFTAWKHSTARLPTGFTIVYRELLIVDIIDRVVPYAANDDAAIVFLNIRADETFAVDRRGSLTRIVGKPEDIGKGRARAMKRIKATAATMGDALLETNRFVPFGAASIEPEMTTSTVVRFG